MAKEIKFGAEARAALERGVNQLADCPSERLISLAEAPFSCRRALSRFAKSSSCIPVYHLHI